jgi:hypothetical protein
MTKHTPGPMIVKSIDGEYPYDICLAYKEGRSALVATVFCDDELITPDIANANARLFAAATDLEIGMAMFVVIAYLSGGNSIPKEVLEWAFDVIRNEKRNGVQVVTDAIAKIRGDI